MKKLTALLAAAVLAAGTMCTAVAAQDGDKSVTLRIEGNDGNLFYDTVSTSAANLEELMAEVDAASDSITIDMQDSYYGGKYIVAIQDEGAAQFGGYDGWMVTVNGQECAAGISSTTITDKDVVVFYYGGSYDMGFQTPVADTTELEDKGVIKFTSKDTSYDKDYNPSTEIHPVAGATVTWYNGDKSVEYVTDADGKITIAPEYRTKGDHRLQISKKGSNGMTLVLRFAPDYKINLQKDVATADSQPWVFYVILLGAAAVTAVSIKRKTGYEK